MKQDKYIPRQDHPGNYEKEDNFIFTENIKDIIILRNKVNLTSEIKLSDIEDSYVLTKKVLMEYYGKNQHVTKKWANESRDIEIITFQDFINSFLITKDTVSRIESIWSLSGSIVLRDLNTFITKSIVDSNNNVEFSPYLHIGKKITTVVNDNHECFKFNYVKEYEVSDLAETFNMMLKKIGLRKYLDLILILSCLQYEEAPIDIVNKYYVKN